MATIGFVWAGEGTYQVKSYPEAASQSFKAGDLVILSSGSVAIATSDDDVWGVALQDASGTTGTSIPVQVIFPDTVFLAQATDATAETNKGTAYALDLTSGSMGVNTGSTTTPAFVIDRLDPRDGPETSAGGRVFGRFVYTSCDAIGG